MCLLIGKYCSWVWLIATIKNVCCYVSPQARQGSDKPKRGLASPKEVSQARKRSRKPRRGLASPEELEIRGKGQTEGQGEKFWISCVSFRLWLVGTIKIICCYVSPQGRQGLASPKEVSQAQKRSRKPKRGLASPKEVSQAQKRSRKPRRGLASPEEVSQAQKS